MGEFIIRDMRPLPGDSCFLLDDGETAIVYDTGFGFTGEKLVEKLRSALGNREPHGLFLTHSHYDHVLGTTSVRKHYPNIRVVASEHTRHVFQKPSAAAVMAQMDQKAARGYGLVGSSASPPSLRVDLVVHDGDSFTCGTRNWQAVALPGHTRCSMGFWLEEERLLLGTETLGVLLEDGTCLPSFLVGYAQTLSSLEKAETLGAETLLVPHYGPIRGAAVKQYLSNAKAVTVETAEIIRRLLEAGAGEEQVLQALTRQYYGPHVQPVYPRDAFCLNTSIMIRLIRKEYGLN